MTVSHGGTALSLAVSRTRGTVVVTVGGALGVAGCEILDAVLADLIDGQGNLAVSIDLRTTTVEPEVLAVVRSAAHRARRRGGKLSLQQPLTDTARWLPSDDLADFSQTLPR
ncbi:MAG: hypothetical protein ABIS21_02045 [Acidimicrobiales bacterium]